MGSNGNGTTPPMEGYTATFDMPKGCAFSTCLARELTGDEYFHVQSYLSDADGNRKFMKEKLARMIVEIDEAPTSYDETMRTMQSWGARTWNAVIFIVRRIEALGEVPLERMEPTEAGTTAPKVLGASS